MTNWAAYIRKRPTTTTRPVAAATRPLASATNWAAYIRKRPTTTTRPLASATRPLAAATRPLASATRPVAAATRPLASATRPVAAATGGLGFDLSGITGQLQGTGQEIVDKIQSFLPTAFKILLVFIGIKILFWFLGRRR